jgi:ribosomal 50S subunit-recycling heat shock protein
MRLDKYLKVARIIKRRVEVNGKLAKPSTAVKEGDLLTLYLGLKVINVKVKSLTPLKDELMYELLSEEKRP